MSASSPLSTGSTRWASTSLSTSQPLPKKAACLAFVIDPRYLELEGHESRLAVSFGDNVMIPEVEQGFLPIRVVPGKLVFGVHNIGTRGNKLAIFDQWMDTREAPADCTDAVAGEKAARAILESIGDAEYLAVVREDPQDPGPLKVSSLLPLDEYELLRDDEL